MEFLSFYIFMTFVTDAKSRFEKPLEHLTQELSGIRTGGATPALVENIEVEVYGAKQPIKALASISIPDAKTVQIEPWDGSVVKDIETAIQKADLGINPNVDGKTIRLIMPMMTDESRQKMVKIVKEKLEETRIAIRQAREDVKKKIAKQDGISDDDKKAEQKELDETVQEYNNRIDEIGKKKEAEVTTI